MTGNRRRIRDERGKRLLRKRGELLERPFAHCYDTGGMRRTHLRGHPNILKRVLIHVAGFNLGLVMRSLFGIGKPRRAQDGLGGLLRAALGTLQRAMTAFGRPRTAIRAPGGDSAGRFGLPSRRVRTSAKDRLLQRAARADGKPTPIRGRYRQLMHRDFPTELYGQRWQIETVFSMLKRNLGQSLRARRYWSQNREIALRILTHNLI